MAVALFAPRSSLTPTVWTRRLQVLTVACSVVFTIGTAVQNFVIVDTAMLEHTARLGGMSAAEAAETAPGFLVGFRAVGCLFILGNAVGLLALRGGTWTYWVVLLVNAGQGAGVVMVEPEVFQASLDLYGPAGILPTAVTDGGALLLLAVLLAALAVHRAPWAQRRA